MTEVEKKVRKEKRERCRAKREKRRKEREEEHWDDLDQQLLDSIALGNKRVEEAFHRVEAPIDLTAPPPNMDPLEQITKAAIRLGARIDPDTGYLKGFVPVKPEDVISHEDKDEFDLEDACHKGCKCNKKKEEDEDDAEFDAIEEAISQMGDAVTDPKQKCTMCQFFVGKVDRMFGRAARNAPIFIEEHLNSHTHTHSDIRSFGQASSAMTKAAVASFNALPANEQVLVLAHVTASLLEQQALQEDTDDKQENTANTKNKNKAKCPGDGCDGGGGGDDGIGGVKEEVEKAEEKGMEEGIEKEKEKVEEKKGQLEPKEPLTPVKPPNRKERSVMILTGEPPERGATHAQWWLANDMFLNIKPLVFHKFQELCSTRVPGSYADFCQPLFAVYDDITFKLRMGTAMFDVCLSDSFCTEDLRPPSPTDSKGGAK